MFKEKLRRNIEELPLPEELKPILSQVSKARYELARHRLFRRSLTAKQYVCNWPDCNKAFKSSAERRLHERVHTDERAHRNLKTPAQLLVLRNCFIKNPSPSEADVRAIIPLCGGTLTDKAISTWFYNERRKVKQKQPNYRPRASGYSRFVVQWLNVANGMQTVLKEIHAAQAALDKTTAAPDFNDSLLSSISSTTFPTEEAAQVCVCVRVVCCVCACMSVLCAVCVVCVVCAHGALTPHHHHR